MERPNNDDLFRPYAKVSWTPSDIQDFWHLERPDKPITIGQAAMWLSRNESIIQDRMVERGRDVIDALFDMGDPTEVK